MSIVKLYTKRLLLREWHKDDIEDLVDGLNNIEISKWLAFVPHPYTKYDAEKWIDYCMANDGKSEERKSYNFAIEHRIDKKVIGGASIDNINRYQGTAGGGIWINSKYHGNGYGSEAFGGRIKYAFDNLNLRRLENGYFKGNQASLKMQEKYGYKVEGMKRKAIRCIANGLIMDEYITGLLKEEWNRDLY